MSSIVNKILILFETSKNFAKEDILYEGSLEDPLYEKIDICDVSDFNTILTYKCIIDCTVKNSVYNALEAHSVKIIDCDTEYIKVRGENEVVVFKAKTMDQLFINSAKLALYPQEYISRINDNKMDFQKHINYIKTKILIKNNNVDNYIQGLKDGIEISPTLYTGDQKIILINEKPVEPSNNIYITPEDITLLKDIIDILKYKV